METKYQIEEGGQNLDSGDGLSNRLPEESKGKENKDGKSLHAWFKVTPVSMQGKIELGNVSNGVIIVTLIIVMLLVAGILFCIGSRVGDALQ